MGFQLHKMELKQTDKDARGEVRLDKSQQPSLPYKNTICYIASDVPIPSPRGSTVHVTELANNLSLLGHEVHLVCRRTRKDEPKSEKLNGVTVHRIYRFIIRPGTQVIGSTGRSASEARRGLVGLLYLTYLRTLFALYTSIAAAAIIRKNKVDVIVERETSFGAGGLATILTRKPMILEIVGPRYSRLSVWRSKKILYYTESMLRRWVDRKKCIEVSGGVNLSLFRVDKELRETFRDKFHFGVQERVVGYVGTFQDWHGIDTLLHSVKELRDKYPNIRALLVGPYFEKYQALAKALGLEDTCFFTGPVEYQSVPGFVNACDIMVALYEPERNELRRRYGIGSPLKILEYMACGKPVISTDVKPIDKLVQDGYSGCLIKPGDTKGLTLAISQLLDNVSKANSLAVNGQKLVERDYSWKSVASTIDNIIGK